MEFSKEFKLWSKRYSKVLKIASFNLTESLWAIGFSSKSTSYDYTIPWALSTTPEEFGFTLKTRLKFCVHTKLQKFENETIVDPFGFVLKEN